MKTPFFLTPVLILMMISCNSHKATSDKMTSEDMTNMKNEKTFVENDYKKAVVIFSDSETDCPYTISVDGETTLFDPINLENNYKKAQSKIWVKYRPLRMANRCEKANPVEITAIAERE